MKNILYKLPFLLLLLATVIGCDEDRTIYDVDNGQSFAGFQSTANPLVFNPVAETENRYTVAVSTRSSMDRQVVVSVDESSTLDPSFYNIENTTVTIPAGELSADVIITTPASDVFPASGSVLNLNLDTVEGSELSTFNPVTQEIGFTVECPTVDLASIPGIYAFTVDEFGFVLHSQFEIVEGPGENEFTMVNLSGHSNPDAGGAMNYDVVFSINPNTGSITVPKQEAWHWDTFGGDPDYGAGSVEGPGRALTCISQITLNLTHTVAAGSFGTYRLQFVKI